MAKFDEKIQEAIKEFSEPCHTFQWETGFLVITQSAFEKLKVREKKKLLKMKGLIK